MMHTDTMHTMEFDAIRLRVASPEVIRGWSSGEVAKPETINYRTQKPEKGGLFAEEIFGPTKDWECYCGKYKKIRYKGIVCDKCGVEVTHSLVRRERMGHIELAAPVAHIWFLRSIPSKIGTILDLSIQTLEKVIYFANFIVTDVDTKLQEETLEMLKEEYKSKRKQIMGEFKQKADAAREKKGDVTAVEKEGEETLAALEEDYVLTEREIKELAPLRILSETDYQELSMRYGHIFDAQIGADAIQYLLKRLDIPKTIEALEVEVKENKTAKRDKLIRRLKLLKSLHINEISPWWMILNVIPVIPPDLRPMVALDGGRFATSDLNDLYRRVINRNNRLKRLLELNAPEVIVRNEKRMLQEAIDALIDNDARRSKTVTASTGQRRKLRSIADLLKGKQGRFRQNLLGKRTDYSGRSVIVVGPNMQMNECGIPKRMALELFKPFVMSEIIKRGHAHNVRSASRFIEADHDEVWDILEEVTANTRVLLNRAPTLHRLGIQAFKPRLIEGKAIRIHPLVCTAFNADFDGDQMAVHVPLTEQAKWEAEHLMAAERNILKPATGQPIATPKQDIVLGAFYMTTMRPVEADVPKEKMKRFSSVQEARLAYKMRIIALQQPIEVYFDGADCKRIGEGVPTRMVTTIGRVAFNDVLPASLPWYNEVVTAKKLGTIVRLVLEKEGVENTARMLDGIKDLGFKYVTKSGYSLGMDDFPRVPEKQALLDEGDNSVAEIEEQYQDGLLTQNERYTKIIGVWTDIKDRVLKHNRNSLHPFGPVFAMIESGARGSWGQLGQVIGMKGLVSNPAGDIIELPVKGNFKEGFSVLEFFISSHGVRKGLTDTALRTANAGYLTRRLVDVAQDVVVLAEDCGTLEGVIVTREESEREMGETLSERVQGRYTMSDVVNPQTKQLIVAGGEMILEPHARELEASGVQEVHVRTVFKCLLPKGVCSRCYGVDMAHNKPAQMGTAVGIIAAQSIGEPGTQLTMRTFHTGGVAGQDITQGLPRVDELFEARSPKKKAFVAEVGGIAHIESAEGKIIEHNGKRIFEGRRGQKIVNIAYDGVREDSFPVTDKDTIHAIDGKGVAAGDLLIEKADGTKIVAPIAGMIRVQKKAVTLSGTGSTSKEYIIPLGFKILVSEGDMVNVGDALTEGHMDLQQLFELKGKEAVQRYILKEIQDIYASQGQKLNDKHIEIIIRSMFSRVLVEDAGDTDLIPGEVVEKAQWSAANAELEKGQKKAVVKELFLGISRVSLSTQSFLSSASFQETAKVLINAAVTGKVDYLEGLKENVIIGRKIPAGTGFSGGISAQELATAARGFKSAAAMAYAEAAPEAPAAE